MSIIARNSLSASGSSGGASFAFALYVDLMVRGGSRDSSSSSSSKMTTPPLTRVVVALLDSVRLDVSDGFTRVLAGPSSSESESSNTDFSFDRESLASALDGAAGGSTGSALVLHVSGAAGLGAAAGFALLFVLYSLLGNNV